MKALVDVNLNGMVGERDIVVYIADEYIYDEKFPTYPIDGYRPGLKMDNGQKVILHKDDGYDCLINVHNGADKSIVNVTVKESPDESSYWEYV